MLDIGWTELLLIGVVALIVIGPKDLPVMFHTLGRITARARGMAREFSSAMDDAARASGVHEVTKDLRDLKSMTSPRSMGLDALTRAADKFEKWDPLEPTRTTAAVPDPAAPAPAAPAPATADEDPTMPSPAPVPVPVAQIQPAAPSATVSGLGLGLGSPAMPISPEPEPPAAGTRRLHAVRRSERS